MTNPDHSSPEKVSIEDLLRLKRAERPSLEFWTRFEQDLRAKQLAAIVEKRPWWQLIGLPQVSRVILRFQLPVGAAAVLALSFVVAGHYQEFAPASDAFAVSRPETPVPVAAALVSPVRNVASVDVPLKPSQVAVAVQEVKTVLSAQPKLVPDVADVAVVAVAAGPATQLTAMVPWGVGQAVNGSSPEALASSHLLVSDPQVASMTNLPVTTLLANPSADLQPASQQAVAVAPPIAPTNPRELRKARIMDGMTLAGDDASGVGYSRAVVAANDLNDAQLYDSIRRVGVGGDRLTLKF